MPGSGLKVCGGGGWWWVGGVQTHFSDQPKSRLINSSEKLFGIENCYLNEQGAYTPTTDVQV